MTRATDDRLTTALGTGAQSVFFFDFPLEADAELDVLVDGTVVNPASYAVNKIAKSVTFGTPPVAGAEIEIVGDTDAVQVVNYRRASNTFQLDALEAQLDRLTQIAQEQKRQSAVTIRVKYTQQPSVIDVDEFLGVGGLLGVDGGGTIVRIPIGTNPATINAAQIIDSTASGRAILQAPTAAAQTDLLEGTSPVSINRVNIVRAGALRKSTWLAGIRSGTPQGAALNALIQDVSVTQGGGIVLLPDAQNLDITDALVTIPTNVVLRGPNRGGTALNATAWFGRPMIRMTGNDNGLENVFVYNQAFTNNTANTLVEMNNCVNGYVDKSELQGGFYSLAVVGNACADNTIKHTKIGGATGTAQVYMASATGGVNGANHLFNCKVNWQPNVGDISAARFKGARVASTEYAIDDILLVGSHYVSVTAAGVTGAGAAPAMLWYYLDMIDGAVRYKLIAHQGLTAITYDTGVSYCNLHIVDMTGPYSSCVLAQNSFAGVAPRNITADTVFFHGPISNGLNVQAGDFFDFTKVDAFDPSGLGTKYGAFFAAGSGHRFQTRATRGFDVGVYCGTNGVEVSSSIIVGNTRGVQIGSNINKSRIVNNELGEVAAYGANSIPLELLAGTGDRNKIIGNNISGATFGIQNAATGVNNVLDNNN
jgi:hypothetical protein